MDDLLDLLDPIREAVDSVNSSYKEAKQMEASILLVKPRRRVIGRFQSTETLPDRRVKTVQHEDVVYDMPFEEQLEQVLQYNPEVLQDVLHSAQEWSSSYPDDLTTFTLSDIKDGAGIKFHQGLSSDREGAKLALGFYGDGVSLTNPIGVFRNNAKSCCSIGS